MIDSILVRRILLIWAFVFVGMASTLAIAQPAQAWFSCGGKDHYHLHKKYKHDARYGFRSGGSYYKRWDIKKRTRGKNTYHKIGRYNAYCYDVDIAEIPENPNPLDNPQLVML
jgi:hypothetical protein